MWQQYSCHDPDGWGQAGERNVGNSGVIITTVS